MPKTSAKTTPKGAARRSTRNSGANASSSGGDKLDMRCIERNTARSKARKDFVAKMQQAQREKNGNDPDKDKDQDAAYDDALEQHGGDEDEEEVVAVKSPPKKKQKSSNKPSEEDLTLLDWIGAKNKSLKGIVAKTFYFNPDDSAEAKRSTHVPAALMDKDDEVQARWLFQKVAPAVFGKEVHVAQLKQFLAHKSKEKKFATVIMVAFRECQTQLVKALRDCMTAAVTVCKFTFFFLSLRVTHLCLCRPQSTKMKTPSSHSLRGTATERMYRLTSSATLRRLCFRLR